MLTESKMSFFWAISVNRARLKKTYICIYMYIIYHSYTIMNFYWCTQFQFNATGSPFPPPQPTFVSWTLASRICLLLQYKQNSVGIQHWHHYQQQIKFQDFITVLFVLRIYFIEGIQPMYSIQKLLELPFFFSIWSLYYFDVQLGLFVLFVFNSRFFYWFSLMFWICKSTSFFLVDLTYFLKYIKC